MATTTPNFGWDIPQSTDLVKDGATAIAALGTDIDTALVDLKGGTTGQVLSKNSNTDLDFTWSSVDPLTILDAKGDLISATAADTPARLASSGVNGDVLTVDTSTSTGLKWAAPAAAGGYTLIAEQTASSSTGIDFTSISSTYKTLILVWSGIYQDGDRDFEIRLNADSGSNYAYSATAFYGNSGVGAEQARAARTTIGSGNDIYLFGRRATSTTLADTVKGYLKIENANSTTKLKYFEAAVNYYDASAPYNVSGTLRGVYNSTSAISQINIVRISAAGTLTNVTNTSIQLWGLS
jgi:hypothetical protein